MQVGPSDHTCVYANKTAPGGLPGSQDGAGQVRKINYMIRDLELSGISLEGARD